MAAHLIPVGGGGQREREENKKITRWSKSRQTPRAGGVGASLSCCLGLSQGDPLDTSETSSVRIVSTPVVLHKLQKKKKKKSTNCKFSIRRTKFSLKKRGRGGEFSDVCLTDLV